MREVNRRLVALEQRLPPKPQRVAIIGPGAAAPAGADFVIQIVPAAFPEAPHA
jgi:hypothetical protein